MYINKVFALILLCGINGAFAMQHDPYGHAYQQPQRTSWWETVKYRAAQGRDLAKTGWTEIKGKQIFWEAFVVAGACCACSLLGNRQILPRMSNPDATKILAGSVKDSLGARSRFINLSNFFYSFGREYGANVGAAAIKPGLAKTWTAFSSKIPAVFGATFAIKFAEEFGSRALLNGVRCGLVKSYDLIRGPLVKACSAIKGAWERYRNFCGEREF